VIELMPLSLIRIFLLQPVVEIIARLAGIALASVDHDLAVSTDFEAVNRQAHFLRTANCTPKVVAVEEIVSPPGHDVRTLQR